MASCSSEDASDTNESLWKCPLCLDSYKCPKLLPCAHTFCKECLVDLLKHQSGVTSLGSTFSCPSCREQVRVPRGGVDAFKNNFYLVEAAHAQDTKQPLCKTHSSKPRELELYCHQCNACICLKCKLEDHSDHFTEELESMAKVIKTDLCSYVTGVSSTILDLKRRLRELDAEKKAVREKKASVEKDIDSRHKMMVSFANKCRDDAVFALDTTTASIESQLDVVIDDFQHSLEELGKLKKRVEKCLHADDSSGLVMTAQEIKEDGNSCEKEVKRLLDIRILTISRPVLHFSGSADGTLSSERKFLGDVVRLNLKVGDENLKFNVKKMFGHYPPMESCDIFSLYPGFDGKVWITYEPSSFTENLNTRCPTLFNPTGEVIYTMPEVKGRSNFTYTNRGIAMYTVQTPGSFETYAKSRTLMILKNHLDGTASVMSVSVIQEKPLQTHLKTDFMINVGQHRTFDMKGIKGLCAVVEEAQHPETQRRVLMYKHPNKDSVHVYTPPEQSCQPSDVCFYQLGCHLVLLVADELNDVIHALKVDTETGHLEFGGYLAPSNSLITRPTALNTDDKGQIWVACRSGDVLMCEPPSFFR